MAQEEEKEEQEQPATASDRLKQSLRKGVDTRRQKRGVRQEARKERKAPQREARAERKLGGQEERTAAKLAYSEAREQGQGVVPAMRQRRQEKMRQRLENIRGRQQNRQVEVPLSPVATEAEDLEFLGQEIRAYPQRVFGTSERRVPAKEYI